MLDVCVEFVFAWQPGYWEVDLNWLALVWGKWTADDKLTSMSCFFGLQSWFFSGLPEMHQFWSNPSLRCVYILLTWICAILALVLGIVSTGYHSFIPNVEHFNGHVFMFTSVSRAVWNPSRKMAYCTLWVADKRKKIVIAVRMSSS